ncbi:MAG: ATP-binding protein [Bacillota bacterium]|nr:ATP-binding protein [Bacillota bacterium]
MPRARRSVGWRLIVLVSLAMLVVWSVYIWWDARERQAQIRADLAMRCRLTAAQFLAVRAFMAETSPRPSRYQEGESFRHLTPDAVREAIDVSFPDLRGVRMQEIWSPQARPGAKAPAADAAEALAAFRRDPHLQEEVVEDPASGLYSYMAPIRVDQGCLRCHQGGSAGTPAPPPGGSATSAGTASSRPEHPARPTFRLGELVGLIRIDVPLGPFQQRLAHATLGQAGFGAGILFLTVLIVYFVIRRTVVQPLGELAAAASRLGRGDLSDPGLSGGDFEIGILQQTLNRTAAELRALYTGLEQRVEERTRELREANERLGRVNAELERANVALARANAAKSEFLGRMSHELKTPLAAILAYAELLQEGRRGPVTPAQRDYLSGILEHGRSLLHSIDRLLETTRIESGKVRLELELVQPEELLGRVVTVMEASAARRGLRFETDFAEVPAVMADAQRISRSVESLLENAIHFSPEGGRIRLWLRYVPASDSVLIGVDDQGPGIDPDEQERIFEPFEQGRQAGRRGTGLGLSLARRYALLHGGSLWVASLPGRGSTFVLRLPVRQPRQQEAAAATPPAAPPATPSVTPPATPPPTPPEVTELGQR